MTINSTNELIWHFCGYLELAQNDFRTKTDEYNGVAPNSLPAPTDGEAFRPTAASDDDSQYSSHRIRPPQLAPVQHQPWHGVPHAKLHFGYHSAHPFKASATPTLHHPVQSAADDGGDATGDVLYTSQDQSGATQVIGDLVQINWLINNNVVVTGSGSLPPPINTIAKINEMLKQSDASLPAGLHPDQTSTNAVKDFVDQRDAHPADTLVHDAAYAAQPGIYVDGGYQPGASSDIHQAATQQISDAHTALDNLHNGPPAPPTGDGSHALTQVASVGGNIGANDVKIVDAASATSSLVVLGDFIKTEAITQTNVLDQCNHFQLSDAAGDAAVGPNTVQNVAEFSQQSIGGAVTTDVPTSTHWMVDTIQGSFVDIKSLVQTNYLSNNDIVMQTTSIGHSEIVTGGNVQLNEADFQNLSGNYDLIIVEGTYHQVDWISQTNVVLDHNSVTLDGGEGQGGHQSVSGGHDSLINDGTIVDMGNHDFQSLSDSMISLVQRLEAIGGTGGGSATLDPFSTLTGTVHALVITGDYYDINYVAQQNIISDANIVVQHAANGGTVGPGGATQTVLTGDDHATNQAIITDLGSGLSPLLQGNYYNDMILIQTNIITDGDKITGSDPRELASELVAFTGTNADAHHDVGPPIFSAADMQHHSDPMAGILH